MLLLALLLALRAAAAAASSGAPACIVASTWAGFDYVVPNWPIGVAVDSKGVVHIADAVNFLIARVFPGEDDTAVDFVGNAGVSGTSDGQGSNALFNAPFKMVFGPSDIMYMVDERYLETKHDVIRSVSSSGAVVTMTISRPYVAGDSIDGPLAVAVFGVIHSLALNSADDTLFLTDTGGDGIFRLRAIDSISSPASRASVRTIAMPGLPLRGIEYDSVRLMLYAASPLSFSIVSFDVSNISGPSLLPTHIAGCGRRSDDTSSAGSGENACFMRPVDVRLSGSGNTLYVSDADTSSIRRIFLAKNFSSDVLVGPGSWNSRIVTGTSLIANIPSPSWLGEFPHAPHFSTHRTLVL